MVKKEFDIREYVSQMEDGQKVREFLDSEMWKVYIKPMFDSFVIGLKDATKIDLSSDKKATIELSARKMAIGYLESIVSFLEEYVALGQMASVVVDRQKRTNAIHKPRKVTRN